MRCRAPLLLILFVACGGTDEEPPAARRQPTGALCSTTSTLSYATFGEPFARHYCVVCHASTVSGPARAGAPVGLDFDSVGGLRAAAARIDRVAAAGPDHTNTDMPPGNPRPSLDERTRLGAWLACGAP